MALEVYRVHFVLKAVFIQVIYGKQSRCLSNTVGFRLPLPKNGGGVSCHVLRVANWIVLWKSNHKNDTLCHHRNGYFTQQVP